MKKCTRDFLSGPWVRPSPHKGNQIVWGEETNNWLFDVIWGVHEHKKNKNDLQWPPPFSGRHPCLQLPGTTFFYNGNGDAKRKTTHNLVQQIWCFIRVLLLHSIKIQDEKKQWVNQWVNQRVRPCSSMFEPPAPKKGRESWKCGASSPSPAVWRIHSSWPGSPARPLGQQPLSVEVPYP